MTIAEIIQWATDESDKAYRRSWEIAHQADHLEAAEFNAGVQAGRTTALQEIIAKLKETQA